jgi:hypothetical protein
VVDKSLCVSYTFSTVCLRIFGLLILQVVLTAVCLARTTDSPIEVSACELSKSPKDYHHRMITVRATVSFAFEDFTLKTGKCESSAETSPTWVELGGDLGSQTIYCCGDHSRQSGSNPELDGYALPLEKDLNLSNFLHLLKAHRETAPNGGPCYDCFYFVVSATFTGRFFAGGWVAQKEGQATSGAGYGHLGCCSMLVVEHVTDLEAQRTKIPDSPRFRCRKQVWIPNVQQESDVLVGPSPAVDRSEPNESAAYAIRKVAQAWDFAIPDTNPEIYRDISNPKWERAHGTWTSADRTLVFSISLKTRGELDASASAPARSDWIPQKITGESCTAIERQ